MIALTSPSARLISPAWFGPTVTSVVVTTIGHIEVLINSHGVCGVDNPYSGLIWTIMQKCEPPTPRRNCIGGETELAGVLKSKRIDPRGQRDHRSNVDINNTTAAVSMAPEYFQTKSSSASLSRIFEDNLRAIGNGGPMYACADLQC
jgi:hypothetical protein